MALWCAAFFALTPALAQDKKSEADKIPPAVNPGRPTVSDPAALTAPGWLEAEFGLTKGLDRDRTFSTPFLMKLTSKNERLQYRLSFDGYLKPGEGKGGFGDTYAGLQYLIAKQEKSKFDIAARLTLKLPTAPPSIGGTKKVDYSLLLLASRDFTPTIHADFNLALASLSRADAPGTDTQWQATASFTFPLKGGRWQYTNEIVYNSPIAGQQASITTLHGFTYAVHRYDVYDIGVQWQLQGGGANVQVFLGKTFFLGKLF